MLLPDLIDKPLYYSRLFPQWATCTRTFGHTGALLCLVLLAAGLARSRWIMALALGMATHLFLDCLMDHFFDPTRESTALVALTWPLLHARFSAYHFDSVWEHLHHLRSLAVVGAEILGILFLGWDYWKSAYSREMKQVLFSRRWRAVRRHRSERN